MSGGYCSLYSAKMNSQSSAQFKSAAFLIEQNSCEPLVALDTTALLVDGNMVISGGLSCF